MATQQSVGQSTAKRGSMKEIIIEPHIGIGQLKLGMTSDELETAFLRMRRNWAESTNDSVQIQRIMETDDSDLVTGRYADDRSFFLVQYQNGRAIEISVHKMLIQALPVKLFGVDVFNLKIEQIIDWLKGTSGFVCDNEDEQLGTEYIFPEIGIRFWRERAFHPKLLENPPYMKEMKDVLEEEYQYQYFELITVML